MKRYNGILYKSRWDASTWGLIALSSVCCLLPLFFDDDGLWPIVVCCAVTLSLIVIMLSVYYRIDGNHLIIYQFFIPQAFPINKIEEIFPIKTYLSAPATSLTHRIGIKFSDRKILKSTMPLVISPAKQEEFIAQLLAINPQIRVSSDLS